MTIREQLVEVRAGDRLQAELAEMLPRSDRKTLLAGMRRVSQNVPCPHNESHLLSFVVACVRRRDVEGAIVEAGCFKGGSTAKLSLVASMLDKRLVAFDSFDGLPENTEGHETSILGHSIKGWFDQGNFRGTLDEVQSNIRTYGDIDVCTLVKGWFDDTMPMFDSPIAAAYLDVDLASSTRTCLKYLYPLVSPGGVLVSQDGDFPLVIDVFSDTSFWADEVGVDMPTVGGLGTNKLITIEKPAPRRG